jgi:hypothetical protein
MGVVLKAAQMSLSATNTVFLKQILQQTLPGFGGTSMHQAQGPLHHYSREAFCGVAIGGVLEHLQKFFGNNVK